VYQSSAVLAWTEKNRVNSVTQRALRTGLVLSLASLIEEAEFWMTNGGLIIEAVESALAEDIPMLLRESDIKWLSSLEAPGSWGRVARHVQEMSGPLIRSTLTHGAAGMGVGSSELNFKGC
jgi:hypothetical protein